MKIPIVLQPQGVIPRDPGLVFRMQRKAPPATAVATETAVPDDSPPPEAVTIGAGADNIADATEIPCVEMRDVLAAFTYNKSLTAETDEPSAAAGRAASKTAWWKIKVPFGTTAWLTADLFWTFGRLGNADTLIGVHVLEDDWNVDPPPFANMNRIASHDDVGSGSGFHWSLVKNVELLGNQGFGGGTTYFIQVDDYNAGSPGIAYGLRVSLTLIDPSSDIPPGEHDPDA